MIYIKYILIISCLLITTIAKSQVSVYAKVDHIIPDGVDTQGGISLTVSGSTSPYTYTWSPGTYSTQNISNQTAGQYTLNVKSASSQTYTNKYSIGYKVDLTNLDRCFFRNDTLKSTSTTYGNAISKNTLMPNTDGWVEYVLDVIPSASKNGFFGFLDSISPNAGGFADIDYGFLLYSPGYIYYSEGGVNTSLTNTPKIGDVLRLERVGNTINYKINGVTKRTLTVSGLSSKILKLKTAVSNSASLVNLGCSFNNSGSGYFTNYIDAFPLIKHLTGFGSNNGSIKATPIVSGTYSYTWQPSGVNTSSITNQAIGQYTLNLKDANNIFSNKNYSIGYKVNWTNLDRCIFRNDTLKSTTSSYGNASSKNTLLPNTDGWVEYVLDVVPSTNCFFGFTDSISPNLGGYSDIDFGFFLYSPGQIYYSESGTNTALYTTPRIGDILRLERISNTINYKINGLTVRTLSVTGLSSKTLKLKAALSTSAALINLGCSFITSGGTVPNYVKTNQAIKHVSGFGANDGSIKLTPKLPFVNTYSWTPGAATTNSISTLGFGNYSVTVTDSLQNKSPFAYNVGYKVKWTNLDHCIFRNDSLIGTGNGLQYSKACSKNILRANEDGWVEMVVDKLGVNDYYLGFSDNLAQNAGSSSISDMDYGFSYDGASKYLYYSENGTTATLYLVLQIGDLLRIERVGNTIYYKVNGVALRTVSTANYGTKALKLKNNILYNENLSNIGCSFYRTDSSVIDNYVEIIPLIKHSSGVGINDGSISVKPRFSGLQNFSWPPSSASTATISALYKGSNTVTVTDSSANQSTYTYNVGYKAIWKNLTNGFFRNDTLKGGSISTAYNYACTKNVLPANTDGWFEYVITSLPAYNQYIGFVDSSANNTSITSDIEYGFYYFGSSYKYLYPFENGSAVASYLTLRIGDVLRIERVGNTINYKINGQLYKTTTNIAIGSKTYKLKAKLQYNTYLTNIGMSVPPCLSLDANAGVTQTITCTNTIAVLSGTSTASGVSYSWTPSGSSPTSYSTSVSSAGTYTLKVSNTSSCSAASTVAVITNTLAPVANAGFDKIFVSGSISIGGTPTASLGTTPYSYTWTPNLYFASGSTNTQANPSVTPTASTVYTLTVSGGNGCLAKDMVLITNLSGNISYGILKKDVDGSFFIPIGNKVYFKFEEEYAGTNFNYKIYDYNSSSSGPSTPINTISCTALSSLSTALGDNRHYIDLTTCGTFVSNKIYLLEVTNSKNEKFYLKFKA